MERKSRMRTVSHRAGAGIFTEYPTRPRIYTEYLDDVATGEKPKVDEHKGLKDDTEEKDAAEEQGAEV